VELERLCLAGDEDRARKVSDTIGAASAHGAGAAALARYVRRHALTPDWLGARDPAEHDRCRLHRSPTVGQRPQ
jgi:hypothetical protein